MRSLGVTELFFCGLGGFMASCGFHLEEVEAGRLFSAKLTREQAQNFPLGENIMTYTMLFAYEEKWSFHNYFDHDGYNDDEPIDDNGELTIDCNE